MAIARIETRGNDGAKPEEGDRRKNNALTAFHLTIVGLCINLIGASVFWIELPERMKVVLSTEADHELRLRTLEREDSKKQATLERIDERTRAIQEALIELRHK